MKLTVSPSSGLSGTIDRDLPGDKSISHRAALFAALANGESCIEKFQVSGVTRPMLQALTALGVNWQLEENTLTVQGTGLTGLKSPTGPIDCGNSATTFRLLAGAIAAAGIRAELDGSAGLRRRPMNRIIEPLRQMGVGIRSLHPETAPLLISDRPRGSFLLPLSYRLPIASAQVKTCLLLAGLGANGKSTLREPGPSRDHSERMLASMGVQLLSWEERTATGSEFVVEMGNPTGQALMPLRMCVPGDPSAAAFLIVAALITPNSHLLLKEVCLNPTRTGLLEALTSMGAAITCSHEHNMAGEPVGDITVTSSPLHGTSISGALVVRMIDEFPIFAIAAAAAEGKTVVHDAAELRLKESDRISILAGELRALGVQIDEHADGFTVTGGEIKGGEVAAHGDHRLAMSLAIAGLAAEAPVTVNGAECISESFPNFTQTLIQMGTAIQVEEEPHG